MRGMAMLMVGLWTGSAFAQAEVPAPLVRDKKVLKVDLLGAEVDGQLRRPGGITLTAQQRAHFRSLIGPRAHFRPGLMRSVDGL